jgi:hypothetical protein
LRAARGAASMASAEPQPEQNRASPGFDRLHTGQTRESVTSRV